MNKWWSHVDIYFRQHTHSKFLTNKSNTSRNATRERSDFITAVLLHSKSNGSRKLVSVYKSVSLTVKVNHHTSSDRTVFILAPLRQHDVINTLNIYVTQIKQHIIGRWAIIVTVSRIVPKEMVGTHMPVTGKKIQLLFPRVH